MATLQDVLSYILNVSLFKRERSLTIERPSRFVRRLHRRREPRRFPYAPGPLGGYLVPFLVRDLRGGEDRELRVEIEMAPPTRERPYWFPLELEISFLAMCALTHMRPAAGYRKFKSFQSIRYVGSRIFFDRDTFYEQDWATLDRTSIQDAGQPIELVPAHAGRAGRHRADCRDHAHWGKCPVPSRATPPRPPGTRRTRRGGRWTADLRMKSSRPSHTPRAHKSAEHSPSRSTIELETYVCLPERPTTVELRLWRMAGEDPKRYAQLALEYSDEVAAARAAGLFAPTNPKHRR